MRRFLILLPLMALMACTTTPETPAQTVYTIESSYAAGLRLELAYSHLPRCGKPASPTLCSQVSVIRKLQKADDAAYDAIKAAEKAARTEGYGENRVTTVVATAKALTETFVTITDTLEVQ